MNDMTGVGIVRQEIRKRVGEINRLVVRRYTDPVVEKTLLRAEARVRELTLQKLPTEAAITIALRELFPRRQKKGSNRREAYRFAIRQLLNSPELSPVDAEENTTGDVWPPIEPHSESDYIPYEP